ncbi:unnamed protein product [Lactuca saligna]|uniref:Uncharacterized protein n=1 Tax=Lactuca saligna TaxID=75948 RepID=A0AA35ZUD2_LACSI|nr:unnamed protein product [Lactuca saligna]
MSSLPAAAAGSQSDNEMKDDCCQPSLKDLQHKGNLIPEGHKVLIFSQSCIMLDIIQNFPGAPTFFPGKPIWPDLCIASYKVDHTCLAKRYSVCFQICLLPEFFFFLSWQPSTVVWDRHLLAKDIVYVFFCCYCGFGNILAYWSNCMYLT